MAFSWLRFTMGMTTESSLPVARKARTLISSSNVSQRTNPAVNHHTQLQVGTNTPSSGMALVRMHSKPCLLYRRRWEASGTASLTMCRQPITRKWLRTERPRDVRIPYTTREDTYNYYEERNYVNDVNREHTEVL